MMMIAAAVMLKYGNWVKKRATGTQPEEEVGVGQMMTLEQPVDHVMSESCATATATAISQCLCVRNMTSCFTHAPLKLGA